MRKQWIRAPFAAGAGSDQVAAGLHTLGACSINQRAFGKCLSVSQTIIKGDYTFLKGLDTVQQRSAGAVDGHGRPGCLSCHVHVHVYATYYNVYIEQRCMTGNACSLLNSASVQTLQ
jgi:hypothetical protein